MKKAIIYTILSLFISFTYGGNTTLTPSKGYRGQKLKIKFSSSQIDLNQVSPTAFALFSASSSTIIPGLNYFSPTSIQNVNSKEAIGEFDFSPFAACGKYIPLYLFSVSSTGMNLFEIDCDAKAIVSGFAYIDANNNQIFDANETPVKNLLVKISPLNIYTYTNELGYYQFKVPDGSYTVSLELNTKYSFILSNNIATTTASGSPSQGNNFGLKLNVINDLSLAMNSNCFRADRTRTLYLQISNDGTTSQSTGFRINLNDSLILQSIVEFSNGIYQNISFVNSGSNNYTVNNTGSIKMDESRYYMINIYSKLSTLGITSMNISADILYALTPDATPLNNSTKNTLNYCSSFDPNDKSVIPAGLGSSKEVLKTDWLEFTIRFQNTGTDTAYLIYVDDTLDKYLDISTFSIIGKSHKMSYFFDDNNKIRFVFPDIDLVDSGKNQLLSNGYVKYKIKALSSIPEGYVIKNTGYIYFDYNAPIVTNTTNSKMVTKYSRIIILDKKEVNIYPIPVTIGQYLTINSPINNITSVEIYDLSGKLIMKQIADQSDKKMLINIGFEKGIYITKVILENGDILNKKISVE